MELLDIASVAAILNVSKRMVWQMRDAGRIPKPVKVGRLVRWRRSDIETWIEQGCPRCIAVPKEPRGSVKGGRS